VRPLEFMALIETEPQWVDDQFKLWMAHPTCVGGSGDPIVVAKDGQVDLVRGVKLVQRAALEHFGLAVTERTAREVFAVCVVTSACKQVDIIETLWYALNAFVRTASKTQA